MIAAVIRWSARNVILVLIGAALLAAAGIYAVRQVPLDAIPDLSDTQVIVYTEYAGQAPQVVEDQVTFPLSTALLSVPRAHVVRGFSFFGASFIYVIFEDGTDIYWARSRVLEYLAGVQRQLPSGVVATLGPDASGIGWIYQYAVIAAKRTLAELRTTQDWQVRFAIAGTPGVAEVASVGGFQRQYAVVVDPRRLKSFNIPLTKVREAIRASNMDVGGRVVELAETEFMVRGRGYFRGITDIEQIVLKAEGGASVLLRDVARVELAPDERRGVAELNGEGEAVSGIVVQRYGANALTVIDGVKAKLAEIAPALPEGTEIVPVYDRSELIKRAIATLKSTLIEESLIVALVCVIFLLHVRSALVAIVTLPLGVLIAYILMHVLGLSSNIMSLGGIAIAIGAMVDAAIVMIENAHKHLERAPPGKPRAEILIEAAIEVGPALFFSLLIITVSFLPIFALEAQEGRLFKPLAFTKTFAMAAGAFLSVTLVPALMMLFVRGRIIPEHKNPINRVLIWVYRPIIAAVLKAKTLTIVLALLMLAATLYPMQRIGSEFMPTLDEGTLLYMPTTLPGLSITKAAELLQTQNKIIKSFPEVDSVWGKAGRAATATDPAPTEMFETTINLKPHELVAPGHDHRQARGGDGQGAAVPRRLQRLDHADQGPHRHAGDRHPHARRRQGFRPRPLRDRAPCAPDRGGHPHRARNLQRVRRAHHRRLLHGDHARPRAARPLRPHRRRPAERRGLRARCRAGDDRRRGPRALYGQCPLSARHALRSASDRARGAGAVAERRVRSARKHRAHRARARAGNDPYRERAARRLHLCRRARARSRLLRRRRQAGRCERGQLPTWLLRGVERAVRILRAGEGTAHAGRASDARDRVRAALPQLPPPDGDADRHGLAPLRPRRRAMARVADGIQPVGRRRCRLHRPCRRRRRDRRRHADLPRTARSPSGGG